MSKTRGSAGKWSALYTSTRWRKARARFLRNNPLCVYCEREGRTEVADVVDHSTPHKGDMEIFWDESRWQSLCFHHHNSTRQAEDKGAQIVVTGVDGWPLPTGGAGR